MLNTPILPLNLHLKKVYASMMIAIPKYSAKLKTKTYKMNKYHEHKVYKINGICKKKIVG